MDDQQWQAQRTSFGAAAGDYEQGRPGYPEVALEWITGTAPCRVLDLGAGTGILTRQLLAGGHDVIAVEPLPEMRSALIAASPGVTALDGSAESIPLPDGAVDVVVVGQAYHWFVPERAHPEIARVLRPAGIVGLLWNFRDDTEPWVGALSALLGAEESTGSSPDTRELPDVAPYFGPAEAQRFQHVQQLDLAQLLAMVGSRSYVITLPPEERATLFADVAALTRTHPDLAGRQTFSLPYVTRAYRAVRAT